MGGTARTVFIFYGVVIAGIIGLIIYLVIEDQNELARNGMIGLFAFMSGLFAGRSSK